MTRLDGSTDPRLALKDHVRTAFREMPDAPKGKVCTVAAARFAADFDGSALEDIAAALAGAVYPDIAKSEVRSAGKANALERRRATEVAHRDGERIDVPPMQLHLFEAQEVATRKVQAGQASIREGRIWFAIVNAALVQASRRGLDLESTRLGDVLTDAQVEAILDGVVPTTERAA